MVQLSNKVKEQLALLYEYPEFKALEAWNRFHMQKAQVQMTSVVMGLPGSSERIAMLQGQSEAHNIMLEELKRIHKKQSADASAN